MMKAQMRPYSISGIILTEPCIKQQRQSFFSFVSVIVVFLISLPAWIIGLRFTILYMNQRNKTEEELRQSWEFLDKIVDNLPVLVFIKDAKNLKFIRYNKAGADMLGYSMQDLFGKNDYDFFPTEQGRLLLQERLGNFK